ncbi:MAG: hypothetical protein SWK90_13925 [Chloroflexota bacterium]|nr:hypothetical protein [Chloroflexota bacterium]
MRVNALGAAPDSLAQLCTFTSVPTFAHYEQSLCRIGGQVDAAVAHRVAKVGVHHTP